MNLLVLVTLFAISLHKSDSSIGDRSPYYMRCVERCGLKNCTGETVFEQPVYLELLQWSCEDECRYGCMWKTVQAFHERNWKTPQFYGKWPFLRLYGVQEPASACFSLLNFYAHSKMINKFRREVDSNSPLYFLWHMNCIINLNTWLWSTIFHTRDFRITEVMDYACGFSLVLMSCYCMIMRLLVRSPKFVLVTITSFFVAFLANHVAYLTMGKFDYAYNMKLNIGIGTLTAICWFGWSIYNRRRQPYVKKCVLYLILTGICMSLEVLDMPPLLWTFDCHSMWHLSTAPLVCLFYSFIIDDCKYLSKLKELNEAKLD